MVTVVVSGSLTTQRFARAEYVVIGDTVSEAIDHICSIDSAVQMRLFMNASSSGLSPFVAVIVDGRGVGRREWSTTKVDNDSVIHIVRAISGG